MPQQKKIAFYFQQLTTQVDVTDDIPALIEMHTKSFERHGWTVVHADETDARRHPKYDVFDNPSSILGKSRNLWEYTRACYMRWLAYSMLGIPYADFDVINYDFSPADADSVRSMNRNNLPILLSGTGAMGLTEGADYDQIIDTFESFIENPVISGPLEDDINDMTIMRHFRPRWYDCIPYTDPRFVKDYRADGWDNAAMVHYTYGSTGSPRASIINKVRPPTV